MDRPIFLKPVFQESIWGGCNIRESFGYDAPIGKIGECWAISGHPHKDCRVVTKPYDNLTLSQLYAKHRELFGVCKSLRFPLISKIIDANDDLSIQVHPDNFYANINERESLGKSESWYVLKCKRDATIIMGQRCRSRQEFASKAQNNQWDEILLEQQIKPGDFMQINPGTVHAIKAGTIILENQQSSDITYRIYDYDRLQKGRPRELHLAKALDVIDYSAKPPGISNFANCGPGITVLERNSKYCIEMLNVDNEFILTPQSTFVCCNVLDGRGAVIINKNSTPIYANTNFILPAVKKNTVFRGHIKVVLSRVTC